MIPPILKKQLAELKIVSITLFVALILFIVIFVIQLFTQADKTNPDKDHSSYFKIDFDLRVVTGLNILIVAYGVQTSFFPTFNSMGSNRTNSNALKMTGLTFVITSLIYMSLGYLAIFIFGNALHTSVLDNVDEENAASSFIIRIAFMIVLACHIPFVFFPCKESFLIIVDEARNKSMARFLTYRLLDTQWEGNGTRGDKKENLNTTNPLDQTDASESAVKEY